MRRAVARVPGITGHYRSGDVRHVIDPAGRPRARVSRAAVDQAKGLCVSSRSRADRSSYDESGPAAGRSSRPHWVASTADRKSGDPAGRDSAGVRGLRQLAADDGGRRECFERQVHSTIGVLVICWAGRFTVSG